MVAPSRRSPAAMPPKIVTLTLNPTVDVACDSGSVRPVHKVRTFAETYDPGGGGVNVARVLKELGADVTAVVCSGGVSGHLLIELLAEAGVPCRAVRIADRTRICMTVHDVGAAQEYRFVPEGPKLSEAEWQAALAAAEQGDPDWLIASGSLPREVPEDFYARVVRTACAKGQRVVLDTSGPAMRAALGCGLALIKPSHGEFETLCGRPLREPGALGRRRWNWCATARRSALRSRSGATARCWRPPRACGGNLRWRCRCAARSARATVFWPRWCCPSPAATGRRRRWPGAVLPVPRRS
jgi:1-phosphofructokinase family hexose kinase